MIHYQTRPFLKDDSRSHGSDSAEPLISSMSHNALRASPLTSDHLALYVCADCIFLKMKKIGPEALF